MLRLINKNTAWYGTGFINDEDAMNAFKEESFGLVLLGGGITIEEE
ncbi:MAG: hypothetical protein AAGI07_02115 [Bacteroidota bacterium]